MHRQPENGRNLLAGIALAAGLGCVDVATARPAGWVPTDLGPVPVERVIGSVERLVADSPGDVEGHYLLARLHGLAFAGKSFSLQYEGFTVESESGVPVAEQSLAHLQSAIREYKKTTAMAGNTRHFLGLASTVESGAHLAAQVDTARFLDIAESDTALDVDDVLREGACNDPASIRVLNAYRADDDVERQRAVASLLTRCWKLHALDAYHEAYRVAGLAESVAKAEAALAAALEAPATREAARATQVVVEEMGVVPPATGDWERRRAEAATAAAAEAAREEELALRAVGGDRTAETLLAARLGSRSAALHRELRILGDFERHLARIGQAEERIRRQKDPETRERLEQIVRDSPNDYVRSQAAASLRNLDDPGHQQYLMQHLAELRQHLADLAEALSELMDREMDAARAAARTQELREELRQMGEAVVDASRNLPVLPDPSNDQEGGVRRAGWKALVSYLRLADELGVRSREGDRLARAEEVHRKLQDRTLFPLGAIPPVSVP